jgi:hypothetical protein
MLLLGSATYKFLSRSLGGGQGVSGHGLAKNLNEMDLEDEY